MAQPTNATNQVDLHAKLHDAVADVHMYGAVGNGSTDDTTAVAAAYSDARSLGVPVLFPPGTYIVSAQLDPVGTTTMGYGATVKHKGSITDFNLFVSTGAFRVYGLTVDMNKSNVTDPADPNVVHHNAFYLSATAGWTGTAYLQDVVVSNAWGAAIRLGASTAQTDADSLPAAKAVVSGCTLSACDYGLFMWGCNGVRVVNNSVSSTVNDGIWDYMSLRLVVAGNTVDGCGGHGIVTQHSRQFVANGNAVSGCTGDGIVVGGGSVTLSPADKFSITGNVCKNNTLSGIAVDTSKIGFPTTLQNVYSTVAGNTCTGNGVHGVYGENAGYLAITGNTCQGNASGGIALHGYRCTVMGNICTGNTVEGIGIVGVAGTKGEHRIAGNVVAGNPGTAIYYDAYARIGTTTDINSADLATTETDGFVRIPTCAGVPTGVPTTIAGTIPMVYDRTNNNLYAYNGGWKKTTVFA
jgi:parallel beta-helix repeat protein